MARALADDNTSVADADDLRANSEAFCYKLDDMEFNVKKATKSLLQDNEKYILCLETPETSLMSVLLANTLKKFKKEHFSNQYSDQVFTDFNSFIKINKQQSENYPNFPDLLVCKVGIDEQLEQYSEALTLLARLVKEKSKKVIFIMKNSKYLEQIMMKTKTVNVLKLKFTELWEEKENQTSQNNQEHLNKQTINIVVPKAITNNVKVKEETSDKSALPNEAKIIAATSILRLLGVGSISAVDDRGNNQLHLAAKNGQNEIVKALLVCDAGMQSKNHEGYTPLHLATEEGNYEVVRTLLENGANVNATAKVKEETALYMACCKNDVHLIQLLLKFNAQVDKKCKSGYTALHMASHYGNNAVVNMLLEHGPNVNLQDIWGKSTPLHLAVAFNNQEVVLSLLQKGADTNIRNSDRQTALDYAKVLNRTNLIQILEEHVALANKK